jgi:6-pyruvoyltetrahydropterin/6-carboxytetrahydropterin synthase
VQGFQVAIETNGTRALPAGLDWICVSPKAGAPIAVSRGDELKVVFPQPVNLDELLELDFTHHFLQPMDGPSLVVNTRETVRYCLEHPPWRLSQQTHKPGNPVTDRFELQRTFRFEAAHHLPAAPNGHPCREMHGHSYEIEIHINGPLAGSSGWVIDFADIDAACEPIRQPLDHRLLNDIPGLENPTSENVARWIWQQLHAELEGLVAVVVRETPRSACLYCG